MMTFARLALPLLVLSLAPPLASAQPAAVPPRPLSLEEALDLAEARSERIAIARAGVQRAEGEEVRARSELYPQLSASASYDRALASEFSGLFDDPGGAPPCDPFVAPAGAGLEERVRELERAVDCGATGPSLGTGFGNFDELPFGRRNTYRVNLQFSQNLYSGGRIAAGRAIAAAATASAELDLAAARAELLLDVVRAYYDAALAGRMVEIAEASYEQADAILAQTRLGFETGTQPEFELLRAQVTRDNLLPQTIRRRSERDIARLRLKQLLDLPADETIALSTAFDGETLPPPARFAAAAVMEVAAGSQGPSASGPGAAARSVIRQAESAVRQSEAALDIAQAQRRPSLSVTSTYGEVAYSTVPSLGDFRRNWTVGAVAQVPLLTGGRIRADQMVARANIAEAQARLQQIRELALVDSETAVEELRAAQAAWEASAGTVGQARRAYEIAELRYREGVSTQLELNDARLLLVQAQASRAQSARDLQVARARLALLPDLPLGLIGPSSGAATAGAPAGGAAPPQPPPPAAPAPRPGVQLTGASGGMTGARQP